MVGSMSTKTDGRTPTADRCVAVAVYVLRRRRGEAELLFLRRSGGRFAGQWWPVTGTCEPAEEPLRCAQRELLEETGLSPGSFHETGVTVPVEGGGHLKIYVSGVAESARVRTNWEHDGFRWCAADEAVDVVGEFSAPIVREAVRVFESHGDGPRKARDVRKRGQGEGREMNGCIVPRGSRS